MKESKEEVLKRKQPNNSPPSPVRNLSSLEMSSDSVASKRSKIENQFDFLLDDTDCYVIDLENFVEITSPVVKTTTTTPEIQPKTSESRVIQDNQRYYLCFKTLLLLIMC